MDGLTERQILLDEWTLDSSFTNLSRRPTIGSNSSLLPLGFSTLSFEAKSHTLWQQQYQLIIPNGNIYCTTSQPRIITPLLFSDTLSLEDEPCVIPLELSLQPVSAILYFLLSIFL
jgi:hypothetical protein